MIQDAIKQAAPHANDPPYDKLPADAQRMRSWCFSQVKFAAANDNPFEAEELAAMLAERRKKPGLSGDMPLIVLSRGLPENGGPEGQASEEAHKQDQAELVSLSRGGKQVIAWHGGHHIPLDQPDVVATAVRDVLTAIRR